MNKTEEITNNLAKVRESIEKARNSKDDVQIIAVTKTFPAEIIGQVLDCGIYNIGENRIQEALPKKESIDLKYPSKVTWHLIGHLQTNKVKKAVDHFYLIHSIDSFNLSKKISEYAISINKVQKVLLEVNISGEESKSGFRKEDLKNTFSELKKLKGVEILGLMTIAPICNQPEEVRHIFRELRLLRDFLQSSFNCSLPELSMGMSDDYEVAVLEGATMVRLGRILLGGRT